MLSTSMRSLLSLLLTSAILPRSAHAQMVTVPSTCTTGFSPGTDTVLYTVPYTYAQVLSIIGSYKNLTWSGNPDDTVTLNGTDNTVGTARTYNLDGSHVIETILTYEKPPNGPYVEVHNTALLQIPSANLSAYIPFDGTVVTSICGGKASMFNFTAHFCANNVTVGGAALHMLHMTDAETVGKFLGGQNFTSCAALSMGSNTTVPSNTSSPSASPTPAPYIPNAGAVTGVSGLLLGGAAFAVGGLLL